MSNHYENGGGRAVTATIKSTLRGRGGPIVLADQAGFHVVTPGGMAGGAIVPARFPGVTLAPCGEGVAVAVLQEEGGKYTRYYCAPLAGGRWSIAHQQFFNMCITRPDRAWAVMCSRAAIDFAALLDDINRGNPAGRVPRDRLIGYRSPGAGFGVSFATGAIGERPDPRPAAAAAAPAER
jgi:hypothetical protein